jgi:hypothetical protein
LQPGESGENCYPIFPTIQFSDGLMIRFPDLLCVRRVLCGKSLLSAYGK